MSLPLNDRPPIAAPAAEPIGRSRFGHAGVIALLGGAQALILAAGLARWKIIALVLGPDGVGVAGVIDRTAQIAVQLGALNIPTAALRFLAIAQEEQGAAGFAWLYRTFLRATLSACALVAVACGIVYVVRPDRLGIEMALYAAPIAFALAAVPLTAATNLIRNVLATLHQHRAAAATLALSSVALAAGTYLGLRWGGLTGAYIGALVVGVGTCIALHLLVVPTLRAAPAARGGSLLALLRAHPDIVRFSLTLYSVGFAVPLSYFIVQTTVLSALGLREAGMLTATYTVASGLRTVFTQASTQYLIPLTSRNLPKEVRADEVAKYLRTLLMLLLLGVLPLLLFPFEVLLGLYSRQFTSATAVLGSFILAEVILSVADGYRVLQLGFNDLRGYLITTGSGVLIVATGVIWVAPRYGLRGVALLQVGAALLVLAQSIDRLRWRHGLPVQWRSLSMTIYTVGALSLAVVVGRSLASPGLLHVVVKASIGAALLLGGWQLLPRSERANAWQTLRRRR